LNTDSNLTSSFIPCRESSCVRTICLNAIPRCVPFVQLFVQHTMCLANELFQQAYATFVALVEQVHLQNTRLYLKEHPLPPHHHTYHSRKKDRGNEAENKKRLVSLFTFSRYCKEGNFMRPQRGSSLPQSTHAIGSTRTSHGSGYKICYICQLERDLESHMVTIWK